MIGENGHPVLETDRRYFRRKLNRRVHKARRARTALRWTGIILSYAAVAGFLFWFGARTFRALATSEEFTVHHVEIEGTTNTTPEAIAAALRPLEGRSLAELELREVARLSASDPWVRDASVRRQFPDTLRITVRERRPAALAVVQGLVQVVDEDGVPMGPAGPGLAYDLPVLTGLDKLDRAARDAALERGVAFVARLSQASPEFVSEISELDLSRPDRVVMIPAREGPKLLLDPEFVDRNVKRWLAMRSEIARRTGPLEYADLRWSRRIALKPKDDLFPSKSE